MNIKILPFKYVGAITDLSADTIYISDKANDIDNIIYDEFSHILSRSRYHNEKWAKERENFPGNFEVNPMTDQYMKYINEDTCMNIGNITGIQHMLLDYHMLQAYRKFSQKVLSTEGSWEVSGDNKIRLKPTPKGSFPVVVRYVPSTSEFKLPQAKELASRMMIAECKIMIGHTRRKIGVPAPDGSSMTLDGDSLVSEGREEKAAIEELAISWGEPMSIVSK